MEVSLIKAVNTDVDFLIDLRDITMRKYLEDVNLPTGRTDYLKRINYNFDDAQIIHVNGQAAGLFKASYLSNKNQWYLFQIQVHPDFQNLKLGSSLIQALLDKAELQGASVGLSVLKSNPVRSLYSKLGFVQVDETEYAYEMERKA